MPTDPLPSWIRQPSPQRRPRLVHVNATASSGGVAELLTCLVHAQRARGIPAGWAVIGTSPEFLDLTSRLHLMLQGIGDPALPRRADLARMYRSVLRPQADWLAGQLGPDDVVVLHNVQPLGLAPGLAAAGARVIWHLHVGTEVAGHPATAAVWRFFADELRHVDAVLTTRAEFAPPGGPRPERYVVAPAIDVNAPKNCPLSEDEISMLLGGIGLTVPGSPGPDATVEQDQPLPDGVPVALQVSRWDPRKDMIGVLRCFSRLPGAAHLVLAGPDPAETPEDPQAREVCDRVRLARTALPAADRARIHLVLLSTQDLEQNALLVNALQRRADVVLLKSLAEGFGLALTEAMQKGRAVIASRVGGLRLQVEHGRNGILVDPTDDGQTVSALRRLFADAGLRHRLGTRAATTVAERYLMPRLVEEYAKLVHPMVTGG